MSRTKTRGRAAIPRAYGAFKDKPPQNGPTRRVFADRPTRVVRVGGNHAKAARTITARPRRSR